MNLLSRAIHCLEMKVAALARAFVRFTDWITPPIVPEFDASVFEHDAVQLACDLSADERSGMRIVCPACNQLLGHGDQLSAVALAQGHEAVCPASDDEHREALVQTRFQEITGWVPGD